MPPSPEELHDDTAACLQTPTGPARLGHQALGSWGAKVTALEERGTGSCSVALSKPLMWGEKSLYWASKYSSVMRR